MSLRTTDPAEALAEATRLYDAGIATLRDALRRFVAGEPMPQRVRAHYPRVAVQIDTVARADTPLAYGFVAGPGRFETTLTRPDLFGNYYLEQFRLLLRHHGVPLEVTLSHQPIPVHFSLAEHRQRHARAGARPATAAGAVHRTEGRLLAAPAAPLHRHHARALPELRLGGRLRARA